MKQTKRQLRLALRLGLSRSLVFVAPVVALGQGPAQPTEVERLDTVEVAAQTLLPGGVAPLADVTGARLQAGRRTELVMPDLINANKAVNNARQVFAKIPGANFWENDGTGVQLGIATRGLSPNRSWEFNVRQNGYDISSDVFGYPEAYYTPPIEAVERVEFIRGASSLQHGPQFGGLLNFELKHGSLERQWEVESRQTIGNYGLFSTFNSVGGTVDSVRYYGAVQHRRADGWREFSDYDQTFALGRASVALSEAWSLHADFTYFEYEQRQPAGLTDAQFAADPSQAVRRRNWFAVGWLVPAIKAEWKPTEETVLELQTFAVDGSRDSVGILSAVNIADPGNTARTVATDDYLNIGAEARLRHTWELAGRDQVAAIGLRAYRGRTDRVQGAGSTGFDADYRFTAPGNLENDFEFTTLNGAVYVENLFQITDAWSVTPGFRLERIETEAVGTYRLGSGPGRGVQDQTVGRTVPLFGVSNSYRFRPEIEFYGGYSQAYRPLQFNDVRVTNPVQATDPDSTDSEGWVAEAGLRGKVAKWFRYDLGVYDLRYNDRFGTRAATAADIARLGLPATVTTLRTNIADARSRGIETYLEANLVEPFAPGSEFGVVVFHSGALLETEYLSGTFEGRRLEQAPTSVQRLGSTVQFQNFSATVQGSWTSRQFADAANTETPNAAATVGEIPAYEVWDLTLRYQFGPRFALEGSINNLFDTAYFTRRAGGYPGPGLVPGEGRVASLTGVVRF